MQLEKVHDIDLHAVSQCCRHMQRISQGTNGFLVGIDQLDNDGDLQSQEIRMRHK
jgi:hypothetical protein